MLSNRLSVLICLNQYNPCPNIFLVQVTDSHVIENTKRTAANKKLSPHQTKVAQVMYKFKEGDLHSGKTETIVTNPKQSIAIALSEAEGLEKNEK